MGVVVTPALKSKMAAGRGPVVLVVVVGEIVKVQDLDVDPKPNKFPEPLLDGPATSEHMSALLALKFPASGNYDAILDSLVTTTPTMHVRAAKALFDVIMNKIYFSLKEQNS